MVAEKVKYLAFRLAPKEERLALVVEAGVLQTLMAQPKGAYALLLKSAWVVPYAALEDHTREELDRFGFTEVTQVPPAQVPAEVRWLTDEDGPIAWVVIQRASGLPVLLEAVPEPELWSGVGA
ncbi:hypothetical protein [Thermus hydrothermalis]